MRDPFGLRSCSEMSWRFRTSVPCGWRPVSTNGTGLPCGIAQRKSLVLALVGQIDRQA